VKVSAVAVGRCLFVHGHHAHPKANRAHPREWKVTSVMLLPAKDEIARHLELYRSWERMMLAAPSDRAARGNFEDTGYTLCVLMGKRCAREAVHAAERYLAAGSAALRHERVDAGSPMRGLAEHAGGLATSSAG
jgi:hypothetical protein